MIKHLIVVTLSTFCLSVCGMDNWPLEPRPDEPSLSNSIVYKNLVQEYEQTMVVDLSTLSAKEMVAMYREQSDKAAVLATFCENDTSGDPEFLRARSLWQDKQIEALSKLVDQRAVVTTKKKRCSLT
jgi:hypothetical protein